MEIVKYEEKEEVPRDAEESKKKEEKGTRRWNLLIMQRNID